MLALNVRIQMEQMTQPGVPTRNSRPGSFLYAAAIFKNRIDAG